MTNPRTGLAPAGPDESDLEQNGVDCHDCGVIYDGQDVMECPEVPGDPDEGEPGHAISGVHISKKPLGYADDRDNWHPRLEAYVYFARENWPAE